MFQLYFFSSFSSKLERNEIFEQPGDYLFFLLVQTLLLDVFSLVLQWPVGIPMLGPALIFSIIYYWSRREPYQVLSFFGFSIKGFQFPFALMFFQLLMGGSIWIDLLGLASGHIYYFLKEVVPGEYQYTLIKTPSFITNFMRHYQSPTIGATGGGAAGGGRFGGGFGGGGGRGGGGGGFGGGGGGGGGGGPPAAPPAPARFGGAGHRLGGN